MPDYEMLHHEDGSVVIRYGRHPLLSEIEHAQIRRDVHAFLDSGSRRFVFDWREIRYLPSDAIGILLSLVQGIRRGGGEPGLVLFRSPRLEKLVAVTSLGDAIPITWVTG